MQSTLKRARNLILAHSAQDPDKLRRHCVSRQHTPGRILRSSFHQMWRGLVLDAKLHLYIEGSRQAEFCNGGMWAFRWIRPCINNKHARLHTHTTTDTYPPSDRQIDCHGHMQQDNPTNPHPHTHKHTHTHTTHYTRTTPTQPCAHKHQTVFQTQCVSNNADIFH